MASSRDTRIIIDTAAIEKNAELLAGCLPGVELMAVVKADGYGHGIVPAARAALAGGAASLGVALPEEGAQLRENGVSARILALDSTSEEGALEAARYDLVQAIYTRQSLVWFARAAKKLGRPVRAHIQMETGMRRLGILPKELPALLEELVSMPGVKVEGIFSHFAETSDDAFVKEQFKRFLPAAEAAQKALGPLERHMASSGTALRHPETALDMVRCGVALYGYPPCGTDLPLCPAMSFITSIVQMQRVPAGESVSYGRTWRSDRDSVIATLPVGYGDGYARSIGNRGFALVRGLRAPVVGRVCMDLCMLDVTDIPGACAGDEAVLLGEQGEDRVTAEDWALWCDTIAYEAILRPSKRVRRVVV